jgi:hypothetical protein
VSRNQRLLKLYATCVIAVAWPGTMLEPLDLGAQLAGSSLAAGVCCAAAPATPKLAIIDASAVLSFIAAILRWLTARGASPPRLAHYKPTS